MPYHSIRSRDLLPHFLPHRPQERSTATCPTTPSPVEIYRTIFYWTVPSRDLQHHNLPHRPQSRSITPFPTTTSPVEIYSDIPYHTVPSKDLSSNSLPLRPQWRSTATYFNVPSRHIKQNYSTNTSPVEIYSDIPFHSVSSRDI